MSARQMPDAKPEPLPERFWELRAYLEAKARGDKVGAGREKAMLALWMDYQAWKHRAD